jgi:excisionase family DNA binding protein
MGAAALVWLPQPPSLLAEHMSARQSWQCGSAPLRLEAHHHLTGDRHTSDSRAGRVPKQGHAGQVSVRITEIERRAFFTPRTLAQYLALSERTVRSILASGRIPSYRVGGARRIDPADVDSYLARHRERGAA